MTSNETLCTGCGATVTMQGGRLRDSEANARCPNGYPWHTIAVSLPPVAIKPEKQSAHTPGPFKVEFGQSPDDFIVTEPTGRTLCEPNEPLFSNSDLAKFDPSLRSISREEAIANAYLFAAAPDMLSALKELVRMVGGTLQGYGVLEAPMNAAKAAISKAEDFMEEARRTR